MKRLAGILIPAAVAMLGMVLLAVWTATGSVDKLQARVPGLDGAPRVSHGDDPGGKLRGANHSRQRPIAGEPVRGPGVASSISGAWPWFRGAELDLLGKDTSVRLARMWPSDGPKRLWMVELGEGYAAAAVSAGRVYVLDYSQDASADTMRCLSLDDGREIWRNAYHALVPRNHGMSRTVPAVIDKYVISLGPLCHVACWDAETGKAHWLIDLVLDHGAAVPGWYAGQCPYIDTRTDRLILAPGGKALLLAVDYKTGNVLWESPNPRAWAMTHVSITPMEFEGKWMYVYCGKGGVAGVDAESGSILWETTDWQISMATCPSPVVVGPDRIFLTGGYNAGSLMLRLEKAGDRIVPRTEFRLTARQFGSEQQTPVLWDGHLYGVRQHDKKLVCLDLDGKEAWNSARDKFGSAPYLIADGLLYALNDEGVLTMAEATSTGYKPIASARVIPDGRDSWGPMALVKGRLIVRDFTRMACLDVAEKKP